MSLIQTSLFHYIEKQKLILKKVRIQNFKSIKDTTINLDKLNILIGKNASGKTNLLEFFKFVKKIFNFENFPYRPLVDWWSYSNVVYNQDETKDIIGTFYFKYLKRKSFEIKYTFRFGAFEGRYQIHYEELKFLDIEIIRDGKTITISSKVIDKLNEQEKTKLKNQIIKNPFRFFHERELFDLNYLENQNLKKLTANDKDKKIEIKINFLGQIKRRIFNGADDWSILNTTLSELIITTRKENERRKSKLLFPIRNDKNNYTAYIENRGLVGKKDKQLTLNLFVITKQSPNTFISFRGYEIVPLLIFNFFKRIIFLRHPNFYEIRRPKMIQGDLELNETSENLQRILLNLFLKNGKLPESILYALEHLFNGVSIGFKMTEDGRSFIVQIENNGEFKPPQLSDGFFKVLSILIGLEYSKSLLLIDEIENSLYYEALEFIIDEFRNKKGVQFLISTHSPIIVDLVDLKEIIMVEKDIKNGTKFIKVKGPAKLKKFLAKEGISHSEAWKTEILKEE